MQWLELTDALSQLESPVHVRSITRREHGSRAHMAQHAEQRKFDMVCAALNENIRALAIITMLT